MQTSNNSLLMMVKRQKQRKRQAKGKWRSSTKFSKAITSLRRMKPSERCMAIRGANDKFIRDIVSNVRKLRTKKLSAKNRKLIKQHKTKLKYLSDPKIKLATKRKALSQKGGLLPALLPLLAPLAAPIIKPIARAIFGRK